MVQTGRLQTSATVAWLPGCLLTCLPASDCCELRRKRMEKARCSRLLGSGALLTSLACPGSSRGCDGCVDLFFGGKGPAVGIYKCNGDWNQAWTLRAKQIEETLDGKCFSSAATSRWSGLVMARGDAIFIKVAMD